MDQHDLDTVPLLLRLPGLPLIFHHEAKPALIRRFSHASKSISAKKITKTRGLRDLTTGRNRQNNHNIAICLRRYLKKRQKLKLLDLHVTSAVLGLKK